MKLLGSWSTGFLPGQNLTLSLAKHAPLANILQISARRQTHTHTQLHSHRKSCFAFTINGSLFSTAKPFNHPTDTVSHHCSYRLRIAYIPLLCDTGYCRWGSSDYMCDSVRVPVCVLMLGSQQRWSSLAIHRDAASRERSITVSDTCQVYYVRSFIELIYFVAVCFNQGHSV